jgi:hypothetical protein
MLKSKLIRPPLILIGIVLIGSLFILPINRPAIINAALITPPPRDTPMQPTQAKPDPGGRGDSNKKNGEDITFAALYGQVIDLSTGQPGQGLEVKINESTVRTDSEGRYSLTGLGPGNYTVVLQLPDGATAAPQSSTTLYLAEKQTVTLDLNYYSQLPPSPTPTHTPAPIPTLPLTEEVVEYEVAPTIEDISNAFSPLLPSTGGAPAVWINPGHINNEEGVNGHITIDVINVSDFGAFQATLRFDPKIIEVDEVTLGNLLDSTGRQTNPLVTEIDNSAGEVSFVAFTSGDAAGPNGGGTLAVVSFASKQAGVSDLELDNILLVARLGKKIDAEVGNGRINVVACFGDLNGDEVIDVSDVQAVAGRVGQSLGDPNYMLEYDLNNDGIIDEADVTTITDRLYEICP